MIILTVSVSSALTSVKGFIPLTIGAITGALLSAFASYIMYRFNLRVSNLKTKLTDLKRILSIIIQMETLKNEKLVYTSTNHGMSTRVSDSMMNLIIKLNQEVATNSIYRDTDFNTFYTHLNLVEGELEPLKKDILANIKQVETKLNK